MEQTDSKTHYCSQIQQQLLLIVIRTEVDCSKSAGTSGLMCYVRPKSVCATICLIVASAIPILADNPKMYHY
jgi:hypothetical protein